MKTVALSIVKNEADIIEPFIRHNAAHVDAFLVCDHQSTDGSAELIEQLRNEGYPIFPYRVRCNVLHKGPWMTFLAHEAKALIPGLRYIAPLDADEFIQVRGASLESSLDAHFERHRDAVCFMRWITYVPTADDDTAEPNPVLRARRRFESEAAPFRKIILPARSIRFLLNVGVGAHAAMYHRHKLRGHDMEFVDLCHFPIRSMTQVKRKVMQGRAATQEFRQKKSGRSIHWKQLADAFETESQEMDDLERVARRYLGAEIKNDTAIIDGEFRYLGDVSPPNSEISFAAARRRTSLRLLWAGFERAYGKPLPARQF